MNPVCLSLFHPSMFLRFLVLWGLTTALGLVDAVRVVDVGSRDAAGEDSPARKGCDESNPEFDFYLQVEMWGIVKDTFTMHGLWPKNFDATYPCNCRREAFAEGKLSSLHGLETYWPQISREFRKHEWDKHGTCSTNPDGTKMTQSQYFEQGLRWRENFDSFEVLKKWGVKPGRSYPKTVFDDAFKAAGPAPILVCTSTCSHQYLSELRYCVTKYQTRMECDPRVVNELGKTCKDSRDIVLPDGRAPDASESGPCPTMCPAGGHGPPCNKTGDCHGKPDCVHCSAKGLCTSNPEEKTMASKVAEDLAAENERAAITHFKKAATPKAWQCAKEFRDPKVAKSISHDDKKLAVECTCKVANSADMSLQEKVCEKVSTIASKRFGWSCLFDDSECKAVPPSKAGVHDPEKDEKGVQGAKASAGDKGSPGAMGPPGEKGSAREKGSPGATGAQGEQGDNLVKEKLEQRGEAVEDAVHALESQALHGVGSLSPSNTSTAQAVPAGSTAVSPSASPGILCRPEKGREKGTSKDFDEAAHSCCTLQCDQLRETMRKAGKKYDITCIYKCMNDLDNDGPLKDSEQS